MSRLTIGIIAVALGVVFGVTAAARTAPSHGGVQSLPKRGLYAIAGTNVLGYSSDDENNGPPICRFHLYVEATMAIAVDRTAHLIVPDFDGGEFYVFSRSQMCGPALYTGYTGASPVDVASRDASIKIALATEGASGGSTYGFGLDVCTQHGSTCGFPPVTPLVASAIGVAIGGNGDCWLSGVPYPGSSTFALWYFKGCGPVGGILTKGWVNRSAGGLDVDARGNLVSLDPYAGALYVYHGCDPKCRRIGGPYPLHSGATYGRLNAAGTLFATAGNEIDVYSYAPKSVQYLYNITNGTSGVSGVAYAPGR